MSSQAKRIATCAIRAEFNEVLPVEIITADEDDRMIVFTAMGKTFKFTATADPRKFSKLKWYAKKLWSLEERSN